MFVCIYICVHVCVYIYVCSDDDDVDSYGYNTYNYHTSTITTTTITTTTTTTTGDTFRLGKKNARIPTSIDEENCSGCVVKCTVDEVISLSLVTGKRVFIPKELFRAGKCCMYIYIYVW